MPNRREKRRKLSKLRLRKKASLNGSRGSTGIYDEAAQLMGDVPPAGAINAYVCNFCYRLTIVQHVHAGTTPKYMACQASEDCTGVARSMNYPPNPPQKVIDAVRWEWYRPEAEEFALLNDQMKENVTNGGLVLREKNRNGLETD